MAVRWKNPIAQLLISLVLGLGRGEPSKLINITDGVQFLFELQSWTGEDVALQLPPGLLSLQGVPFTPGQRTIMNGSLMVLGDQVNRSVLDLAMRRPGGAWLQRLCDCIPPMPWQALWKALVLPCTLIPVHHHALRMPHFLCTLV